MYSSRSCRKTIPAESVIQLNASVLAFAVAIAVLTPLVFGLAPALQCSRRDLINPLRVTAKGVGGGFRGGWLRDAVVATEVALSLTLLIGAGLLMRSFVALREVPLGLRADHVFQAFLPLPPDRYKTPEQTTAFFRPLLARLKTLPGVIDAAASGALPPYGGDTTKLEVAGKAHAEDWQAVLQQASQEYFHVLRIEFQQGRGFSEAEVNDVRKVAIVNATFARRYLDDENPVGPARAFRQSRYASWPCARPLVRSRRRGWRRRRQRAAISCRAPSLDPLHRSGARRTSSPGP